MGALHALVSQIGEPAKSSKRPSTPASVTVVLSSAAPSPTNATAEIAADEQLARDVGAGGRTLVERHFRMKDHALAVRDVYGELVHGADDEIERSQSS